MIRAFSTTDKIYDTNGDAVIAATKARVKNEDNGDFILELVCGSEYNDFIQANNIIVAPTPQGDQAFRVRQVEKRGNRIEAKCYHVFYDAENYLIADSYAYNMTAKQALEHFNTATDNTSPFTVDSDITSINNLRIIRGSLAEAVISVIERWGGHLYRDNFNVSVKSILGTDNGITIEYKKNLKELTASYDWSGVITKLLPVGKDGILIDGLYVSSATQYDIPFTKTLSFEQDIDREEYQTDEQYIAALKADLREQAQNYVNVACVPTINYTLKGNPEKVTDIGDVIEVKDSRIGVNILTKVIAYEYDAIANRYVNLEFGNFTPKLSSLMSDIKSETSIQIANATSNINIEVNAVVDAITALNSLVAGLERDKQDVLTAGQGIDITNNIIKALEMVGATSNSDGTSGIVPQPLIADKDKFLSGDGTWKTASGGGSGVNYSTTEQDTGLKWYDGRPIYQKTILHANGLNSMSWETIDNTITTSIIDNILLKDIKWNYSNYIVAGANTDSAGMSITLTANGLSLENQTPVTGSDFVITILYTKVADITT